MRWLILALLTLHGSIHLVGAAKAFGWAELPQLVQPISRVAGVGWLLAAAGFLTAAVLLVTHPRVWWLVALAAVVVSQVVIVASWSDAWYGTVANVLVLVAALHASAAAGPFGLAERHREAVAPRLARQHAQEVVTEADLARLPEPVQRYLRITGSVGRPRVRSFTASWRGRIRSDPDDPWMAFTAEQVNDLEEPSRVWF